MFWFGRGKKKSAKEKENPTINKYKYSISTNQFSEKINAPESKTPLMAKMTAVFDANRRFPVNTYVKITIFENGKQIKEHEIYTYDSGKND